MRRAIRCKIHPDSCDREQAVGHPESCSKMKHLRPETVPIFWGCKGSGLEPWRARPCKDDTQLTGPATPHRNIAQLGKPSRLTCALGRFSFGGGISISLWRRTGSGHVTYTGRGVNTFGCEVVRVPGGFYLLVSIPATGVVCPQCLLVCW